MALIFVSAPLGPYESLSSLEGTLWEGWFSGPNGTPHTFCWGGAPILTHIHVSLIINLKPHTTR